MPNASLSPPLHQRDCHPRKDDTERLAQETSAQYLSLLDDWALFTEEKQPVLEKTIPRKDFNSALELATQIGHLADEQDHHPSLQVEWGKLTVRWWTHSLQSISENDFIMAAKVEQLLAG